jgi:NAD(P)-dependent dehydrogenase (short-subunit alcohol dehydrogenase family)
VTPSTITRSPPRRGAIVTGGGSGLGRATALVLAGAGIDCVIAGRRIDTLQETAAQASGGGVVVPLRADVNLASDRERLVATCRERFGRVDILVNNAGGGSAHPLDEFPEAEWRESLEINLSAPFLLSQLVIPGMRRRGFGRIVNIASILGIGGTHPLVIAASGLPATARGPGYAAAKGGLINLTRELAVAVARDGITVNTVSPGYIERPERPRPAAMLAAIEQMTPMGRAGKPADIAHAVRYLCSAEAGFVTGVNLLVDGGWSAA